jgi:hypothetical protein
MSSGVETPGTIDDVLCALDGVVEKALVDGDRIGYFAAIYRKVTAKVKEGIATGFFDDGPRMEHFDVTFAGRFLDAVHAARTGGRPTRCWEIAFETARSTRPIILQHLILGINAHINLDLGIAAAETAPGPALPGLRVDFDRVNEILALLIDQVQREIDDVSPAIAMLNWLGGRHDEEVLRFSIEVARAEAWRFATELAPLDRTAWGGPIGAKDARTAALARMIRDPGPLLCGGLLVIRAAESNDVRRVIRSLADVPEPDLCTVEARVREERAPGG